MQIIHPGQDVATAVALQLSNPGGGEICGSIQENTKQHSDSEESVLHSPMHYYGDRRSLAETESGSTSRTQFQGAPVIAVGISQPYTSVNPNVPSEELQGSCPSLAAAREEAISEQNNELDLAIDGSTRESHR